MSPLPFRCLCQIPYRWHPTFTKAEICSRIFLLAKTKVIRFIISHTQFTVGFPAKIKPSWSHYTPGHVGQIQAVVVWHWQFSFICALWVSYLALPRIWELVTTQHVPQRCIRWTMIFDIYGYVVVTEPFRWRSHFRSLLLVAYFFCLLSSVDGHWLVTGWGRLPVNLGLFILSMSLSWHSSCGDTGFEAVSLFYAGISMIVCAVALFFLSDSSSLIHTFVWCLR